ncbi:Crp/Fnr family transcriptional regulator [Methylobacterium aerolatum]|uniref:CRP/FNR family transcriptional regulator n=1 Tax=Methylobacterium aerolatum TaxID=418708 RepID=A0ABU0I263_9HYPH|nr:helix-turn-helix domain-containing protein [Methylobacterium aerolatum]MDQ0448685.1 CRP/FNR family transcriptional regulator [Methylobacterium aerolatum]GJD34991.1 Nitrogen fixation regulation protein FixK [Methylobacterium aerolatum]
MLSLTGAPGAHARPCVHERDHGSCAECRVRLVSVCAALTGEELDELEALSQPLHLAPRQALFGQGDRAGAVYNVTEGMVRLSRLLPDGRRHVMGFAMVGDFLGLALPEHHDVTAEALGPTVLCRFEKRAFGDLVKAKPHLLQRLLDRAGYELSLAHDHMTLLSRRTAEEKVASFLLSLRERYARIGQTSVTVALPMGRQDIADHLGLTIETVSRLLTRLDREKALLIVPGGVRLVDLDRLRDLAAA